MADAMTDLLSFSGIEVQHIFRESNVVADRVASLAHRIPAVEQREEDLELHVLIRKDALGYSAHV